MDRRVRYATLILTKIQKIRYQYKDLKQEHPNSRITFNSAHHRQHLFDQMKSKKCQVDAIM
jgi:hypothetical protein